MPQIRVAAALVLAIQLNQLTVPALCAVPDRAAAACHQTQPAGAPRVTSHLASHGVPCAEGAMCGVPVTALPETAVTLVEPATRGAAVAALALLQPGEQSPPLSPPPQA